MGFLDTGLFKTLWYILTLLFFGGIMVVIIKSAAASWKKSGWKGIIDEAIEAILLLVVYGIFLQFTPAEIIIPLFTPFKFLWSKFIEFVRYWTGIPL